MESEMYNLIYTRIGMTSFTKIFSTIILDLLLQTKNYRPMMAGKVQYFLQLVK